MASSFFLSLEVESDAQIDEAERLAWDKEWGGYGLHNHLPHSGGGTRNLSTGKPFPSCRMELFDKPS